jgi:hypothetical protein
MKNLTAKFALQRGKAWVPILNLPKKMLVIYMNNIKKYVHKN